MVTTQKKRIYNPVTGKYYEVRDHSSKYGKAGEIVGLWSQDIKHCTNYTSTEIMEKFLPKTKTSAWYLRNCIGEDRIPYYAVNGRIGGKPFRTKDGKIMRSGPSTWEKLKIQSCE